MAGFLILAYPPTAPSTPVLDLFPASPGSWVAGYSFRKLRSTYSGSAVQLQRTSDNGTTNVGFVGIDFDTTTANAFASTAAGTGTVNSSRIALPSGTTIWMLNNNASSVGAYWKLGNSAVTAATTDTLVGPGNVAKLTVGTATHVAIITANGTTTFKLTNCAVRTRFDQVNSNDLTQTTQANQMPYFDGISSNGKPGMAGASTGGMTAADNASYKTTKIHQFSVVSWGVSDDSQTNWRMSVGYPFDGTSDAFTMRWGLSQGGFPDVLNAQANAATQQFENGEGFGAVFRTSYYAYDYSTADRTINYLNTLFLNGTDVATLTYPNAVGMYFGSDAAGHGSLGSVYAEDLIASDTQTARTSIVSNQAAYWGVSAPTTSGSTGDGFTWTVLQIGSFAPNGSNETVNGRTYASEGAWASYSIWRCTNVKTSGTTSLGDMYRFEIRQFDDWDGTNRAELDNAGQKMSLDTIYYLSYCWMVESGSGTVTVGGSDWNIPGQAHGSSGAIASPFYFKLSANTLSLIVDDVVVFNSAANFVVFGNWIDMFVRVRKSTTGTTDILDVYFNGSLVHSVSGAVFSTTTGQLYWKYGIYRGNYAAFSAIQSFRYANMQLTTTDITAQIATPLDHPQVGP